jgi:hypothetical protein
MLKPASCRGAIGAVLLALIVGYAVVALRRWRLLLRVARLLIATLRKAALLRWILTVLSLLLGRGVLLVVLIVGIVGARHDVIELVGWGSKIGCSRVMWMLMRLRGVGAEDAGGDVGRGLGEGNNQRQSNELLYLPSWSRLRHLSV